MNAPRFFRGHAVAAGQGGVSRKLRDRLASGGLASLFASRLGGCDVSCNPYSDSIGRGLGHQGGGLNRQRFERDVAARLAEIPDDDCDLTGRLMGDPIPGDRRRAQ